MSSVLDCVKWEIVKVVYFPIVVHVVPWVRIAVKLKSIYNSLIVTCTNFVFFQHKHELMWMIPLLFLTCFASTMWSDGNHSSGLNFLLLRSLITCVLFLINLVG